MDMTEAERVLAKMRELFGDTISNYDVFPKLFQYQVNLAKFQLQLESESKNDRD